MGIHWKHSFTNTNGIRMHYVEAGAGTPMVLLHGFPEFWYSWRYQIPDLAKYFHVVAPDMRGYNETDKPEGVENYKMSLLTADVLGLLRALGHEKAVIVGHDWGGAVAWSFATDYPQATERLIVMNCPHPAVFRQHILGGNLRQMQRSWYIFFFQLPEIPEALFSANNYALLRKAAYATAAKKGTFSEGDLNAYIEAMSKPGALTAAINYYRNLFRGDLPGSSATISSPTLLIWGEEDIYLGKELTEGMQDYFSSRFDIKYIPRCGHWVQQEEPEPVNRYIKEFLSDLVKTS